MVTEQLTEKMRADGRILTKALDDAHLRLFSALWFYFEAANQWRYVFVSPLVDAAGPKEIYKAVQKVLHRLKGELTTINLSNVVAVPAKVPLAEHLQKDFGLFSREHEIQMSRRTEGDQFIDDAYVYRMTNGKDDKPIRLRSKSA